MRFGLKGWSTVLAGFALGGALGVQACGDDEVTSRDSSDVPLFDSDGGFPDVTGTTTSDTGTTSPDVADTRDTSAPDLIPDLDPPVVVSTTPAANAEGVALPLTITIVMNEPVYAPRVSATNIKLLDWLGNEVPGAPTLSADGKTITWKPTTNNQQLASQYTLLLKGGNQFGLSDLAGNHIISDQSFPFTTANFPNQDAYQVLGAKYAPTIHSAVKSDLNAQMQVPTKLDGDSDWNLGNNRQWITTGATQLIPAVYYTVTETRTHYYISYVLYWPYIKLEAPEPASLSHTNANTGVLVVVEKARGEVAERPIAAYTYWREQVSEENFAFVTTESDIVPGSTTAGSWGAKAEMDQATLFPEGRIQLYVTAGYHRTCVRGWSDGGVSPRCRWTTEEENGDTLVFKYLGGSPTTVVKKDNVWPSDMSDVDGAPEAFGYALIPVWSTMWPRRLEAGDTSIFKTGSTFTYNPDSGRPGANLELSSAFVETLGADQSSFGRPFWAWRWNPSSAGGNDQFESISPGQITLDPAHYVWEAHYRVSSPNGLTEYNADTGAGFSRDYCFNGFVNLDVRSTDPKCTTVQ